MTNKTNNTIPVGNKGAYIINPEQSEVIDLSQGIGNYNNEQNDTAHRGAPRSDGYVPKKKKKKEKKDKK